MALSPCDGPAAKRDSFRAAISPETAPLKSYTMGGVAKAEFGEPGHSAARGAPM
jgi:hypothetical protein